MADTNHPEPPSVLHQLNVSNRRLERLLQNLRNEHDAESELRDIAREVIRAVDLNPDIALACIFLCQIAGSYAVRHCIETAVVIVVMSRSLDKTDADILTVTAAAARTAFSTCSMRSTRMSSHSRKPIAASASAPPRCRRR